MLRLWISLARLAVLLPVICAAQSEPLTIAVAANFHKTLQQITAAYEQKTAQKFRLASASSGVLYAQIQQGAPFDMFFAADVALPRQLIQNGLAAPESERIYARGQLVLYSGSALPLQRLQRGEFRWLAIANPKTAPYGVATMQALNGLDLATSVVGKVSYASSVSQVMQFVASEHAQLGFVALSQLHEDFDSAGEYWRVPNTLYEPLNQAVVILRRCPHPQQAQEFLDYLMSAPIQQYIRKSGYGPVE